MLQIMSFEFKNFLILQQFCQRFKLCLKRIIVMLKLRNQILVYLYRLIYFLHLLIKLKLSIRLSCFNMGDCVANLWRNSIFYFRVQLTKLCFRIVYTLQMSFTKRFKLTYRKFLFKHYETVFLSYAFWCIKLLLNLF